MWTEKKKSRLWVSVVVVGCFGFFLGLFFIFWKKIKISILPFGPGYPGNPSPGKPVSPVGPGCPESPCRPCAPTLPVQRK